ncbi:NAD(P)-binding protein [Astrocystis sublimbata]|nr:NAD(P)-binding protein [Astrocystis sublimbata]
MSSYLVTGTSRGIGFELVRQLSEDTNNVVIGLVRDKAATDKKVAAEIGRRPNLHIVQADLTDYDSLKASMDIVAPIVNGALDHIIANAGYIPGWSGYHAIGDLGKDPKKLEAEMLDTYKTNVIGNIHLFNVYMPLVLEGRAKKVIAISSGMADMELSREYKLVLGTPYTLSKVAMNAATVKFHAEYADQGVLFLNICPGVVDTGVYGGATEDDMKAIMKQGAQFQAYSPGFKGPKSPAESVQAILKQVKLASLEGGYGGLFISHNGRGEKWV